MGRSSITGTTGTNQSEDMMSDLARRLQERRAKTDQMPPVSNSVCTYNVQ